MVPLLITAFIIEKRAYVEDATAEEVEALKSRVFQLEKDIIVYNEIPIMSEFSVNIMFDQLESMLNSGKVRAVLFDLSTTEAPPFNIRQLLYKRFEPVTPKVEVFSFNTGKGGLINVALKFFMNTTKAPIKNSIFSSKYDQALSKIYEKLGK